MIPFGQVVVDLILCGFVAGLVGFGIGRVYQTWLESADCHWEDVQLPPGPDIHLRVLNGARRDDITIFDWSEGGEL